MSLLSTNPFDRSIIARHEADKPEIVSNKISRSLDAFKMWKHTAIDSRVSALQKIYDLLETQKTSAARMMTLEMGKLYKASLAEIEKTQWLMRYYMENAASFLAPQNVETERSKSYVSFQPVGPVLCIMPWNFPYWQVFRFAVPALLAGNTVLLKHASNVQGCAAAMEALFRQAGVPNDIFVNLAVPSSEVGDIIRRPEIRGVSLTGSTMAGKAVAMAAGSAMKKCVLELGGSDPYIILRDADLAKAIPACTTGRLMNAGQSCIGAKRFIVDRKIEPAFINAFKDAFESIQMGDPLNADSDLAPMAKISFRDELHKQVLLSIEMGATCITGGYIPDMEGAFYPPTILTNVRKGMPAYNEELFGPVASVLTAENEEHAIELANDTPFGLGAAIFSENIAHAEELIRDKVEAGCCFVNGMVSSDPRLPFGGVKESGYGRELSIFGIREFCNIKTIVVA